MTAEPDADDKLGPQDRMRERAIDVVNGKMASRRCRFGGYGPALVWQPLARGLDVRATNYVRFRWTRERDDCPMRIQESRARSSTPRTTFLWVISANWCSGEPAGVADGSLTHSGTARFNGNWASRRSSALEGSPTTVTLVQKTQPVLPSGIVRPPDRAKTDEEASW